MPTAADPFAVAIARDEIRQLAARYALAIDARDLDSLVGLFVDDVQVGRAGRGREALRRNFDASLRSIGVSILQVSTHVIDVADEGHATGWVYCTGEIEDGDRWIHQAIVYEDIYERRAGRWYFVRRTHELFYGVEAPRNPRHLPPADWPAHPDGRGTLPDRWDTWQRFWDTGTGR
jgi:ketosteroid isomerase-like protein